VVKIAQGTFDVSIDPVDHDQHGIGRMVLTKTWSGDLAASGTGTMLSAGDPASGSAGYVALETVSGTLAGRRGTFALQQFGTMHAGDQVLHYEIVPGSGSDELAGIRGTVELDVDATEHRYRLSYTFD
jgi:hypothetical protein